MIIKANIEFKALYRLINIIENNFNKNNIFYLYAIVLSPILFRIFTDNCIHFHFILFIDV